MCLLWIKKHIVVTVGHRCPSEHVKVTCSAFFQTPVVTQDVPVLGVQPYVASSPAFIMPSRLKVVHQPLQWLGLLLLWLQVARVCGLTARV